MIVLMEVRGMENGRDAESKTIREYKSKLGAALLNETYLGLDVPRDRLGRVEFDGKKKTLAQWARELGISRQAIHFRLQRHPLRIALSRTKDTARPLSKKRSRDKHSSDDVQCVVIEVDPRHCVKRGLTHSERRERRKSIVDAILRGALVRDVANAYGVTTQTVLQAIKEHERNES